MRVLRQRSCCCGIWISRPIICRCSTRLYSIMVYRGILLCLDQDHVHDDELFSEFKAMCMCDVYKKLLAKQQPLETASHLKRLDTRYLSSGQLSRIYRQAESLSTVSGIQRTMFIYKMWINPVWLETALAFRTRFLARVYTMQVSGTPPPVRAR